MMKTRNGLDVVIETHKKYKGLFPVYGTMDGKPCHWTIDGKYRVDDKDDDRDIVDFKK